MSAWYPFSAFEDLKSLLEAAELEMVARQV